MARTPLEAGCALGEHGTVVADAVPAVVGAGLRRDDAVLVKDAEPEGGQVAAVVPALDEESGAAGAAMSTPCSGWFTT